MKKNKILLVEDDLNFGILLRDYLMLNDYDVIHAKNGLEGLIMFKNNLFDLCILDIIMPIKDRLTLAREINTLSTDTPIIFLTAKSKYLKEKTLKNNQSGSVVYLNKPFDSKLLLVEIRTSIQRKISIKEDELFEFNFGKFHLNSKLRHLSFNGQDAIKLSPKENKLLKMLAIHKNDLMKRELALTQIWNKNNNFTSRSMDVFINKIRKYLKADESIEILNIHGKGFQLIDNKTYHNI